MSAGTDKAGARADKAENRDGVLGLLAGPAAAWEPRAGSEADGLEAACLRLRLEEAEKQLRQAREEIRRLQGQLSEQRVSLREELKPFYSHRGILGRSLALRQTLTQARQVAPTNATVLLLGETGTGKELLASAIHELSGRGKRTMVQVNCAAIPATLLESELFGRERGAYTGAFAKQIGSFELANGSTIFLDEVGEFPLQIQAKLLRVLQEMKLQRLGSHTCIKLDVRVIAASNRDLAALAREGRFRQDLYYRLNVFPIKLPPLRERQEDIPILTSAFITEFAKAMSKNIQSITQTTLRALERYSWPGNVRELRNVLERAVILAQGPELSIEPPTVGEALSAERTNQGKTV